MRKLRPSSACIGWRQPLEHSAAPSPSCAAVAAGALPGRHGPAEQPRRSADAGQVRARWRARLPPVLCSRPAQPSQPRPTCAADGCAAVEVSGATSASRAHCQPHLAWPLPCLCHGQNGLRVHACLQPAAPRAPRLQIALAAVARAPVGLQQAEGLGVRGALAQPCPALPGRCRPS